MRCCMFGHGCLMAAVAMGGAQAVADDPVRVRTRVFDIEYKANEESSPLDSVQLWYTADRGATWHNYGVDEDRRSPITFDAPAEGLFGFFMVMTNAAGPSSEPPTRSIAPHCQVFVDYTPPVVQLHPVRQTTLLGQRALQIRWTAIDANLAGRPVTIEFRRPPADAWHPVASDPMANTGRYDWRLPSDVTGQVAIRLAVKDKGGHVVSSEEQSIEVSTVSSEPASSVVGTDRNPVAGEVTNPTLVVAAAGKRARELFAEGVTYRDRGEYRRGMSRMREAVRLDPTFTEAFAEMAGMLYRTDDMDSALRAYEIALEQRPDMRKALRGAAMVYSRKKDFASAALRLRAILRDHPGDALVWMNLGDVAIFQGDEVLARECYTRAIEVDPKASQTVQDARKRLILMSQVSRKYE